MSEQEVLTWIADLFEEPPENITPETERDKIIGWDSLGVLSLMAGLDEKFNILMTDEEMQNLKKVGDVLNVLRKHNCLN
jgi:acyl carrier protein